jgi:hypothetical protein
MAITFVKIASTTLTVSTNTVNLSSIPSTYTDLYILAHILPVGNAQLEVQINDSASYDRVNYYGVGASGDGSQFENSANQINAGQMLDTTSNPNQTDIYIANYSVSGPQKQIYIHNHQPWTNNTSQYFYVTASKTTNTTTVNTVTFKSTGASFGADSTFDVYGITKL